MYTRYHINILKKRIKEPRRFIQTITGPRQVGKTTLVEQLLEEINIPHHFCTADSIIQADNSWIEQQWETADYTLEYPKGSADRPEDPEGFKEIKKQAEEKYDALIKSFDEEAVPDSAPQDSVFAEVFQKCRNNKKPLLDFVKQNKEIPTDFWDELLKIDKKFLWQANFGPKWLRSLRVP